MDSGMDGACPMGDAAYCFILIAITLIVDMLGSDAVRMQVRGRECQQHSNCHWGYWRAFEWTAGG